MSNNDLVAVEIVGQEMISYKQTINISRSEYTRLTNLLDSERRKDNEKAKEEIADFLDKRDIYDFGDFELDGFCILENN